MHTCQALVINCMDFRLVAETKKYLESLGLAGQYDLLCVAGSTKEIAQPPGESARKFLLKNIGISHNLHQARQMILIHHSDCGAYGGQQAFANEKQEKETYVKDMKKSAKIIKNSFPEFSVKMVYANIKDGGQIIFESVN